MDLVLASQSPRRRYLLEALGLRPRVVIPAVDETLLEGEAPIAYALRVAIAKSCAIVGAPCPVLAADTVVSIDGAVLGKASDAGEAALMLARLSGRTHVVHTAVVLRVDDQRRFSDVVSTTVRFRVLAEDEIARYVATGEPMDKAGAYGIQGLGGALVAEIAGSYTNVIGLPLEETLRLLRLGGIL